MRNCVCGCGVALTLGAVAVAAMAAEGAERQSPAQVAKAGSTFRYDACPLDPRRAALWRAGRACPRVSEDAMSGEVPAIRRRIRELEQALAATPGAYGRRRESLSARLDALQFRLLLKNGGSIAEGGHLVVADALLTFKDALAPRVLPSGRSMWGALGAPMLAEADARAIARAGSRRSGTTRRVPAAFAIAETMPRTRVVPAGPMLDTGMGATMLALMPALPDPYEPVLAALLDKAAASAEGGNSFIAHRYLLKAEVASRSLSPSNRRRYDAAVARIHADLRGDSEAVLVAGTVGSPHDQGHAGARPALFTSAGRGADRGRDAAAANGRRGVGQQATPIGGNNAGQFANRDQVAPIQRVRRGPVPDKSGRRN